MHDLGQFKTFKSLKNNKNFRKNIFMHDYDDKKIVTLVIQHIISQLFFGAKFFQYHSMTENIFRLFVIRVKFR